MRRLVASACIAGILAGCAAIPTSSDVNVGPRDVGQAEPFFPMAEGPRPGDGASVTVRRFMDAAAAGVASDFSVAREYLSIQASASWDPTDHVIVYSAPALTGNENLDAGTIEYRVPVAATIDSRGRLREGTAGERVERTFFVTQDTSGRWRIASLDDGVVISEAFFNSFYRPVELVFASPDRTTVVSEVRWLPANNVATVAARELLAGPSSWLADAVATGFPAGASLEVDSVVVENNVATVELNPSSVSSAAERDLILAQLRLTLTALPNVQDVAVTVAGVPLTSDQTQVLTRAPVPDSVAVALVDGRLGTWDGSEVAVMADARVPSGARDVAVSYDGTTVAMVVDSTTLVTTTALADAAESLVPPETLPEEPPEGEEWNVIDVTTVVEGQDLLAPSFDRFGWVWTYDRAEPSQMIAASPTGQVVTLDVPALEGRTVTSLAVSRDGSRMAVSSRFGSEQLLDVVGVARSADGVPLLIGDLQPMGEGTGLVQQLTWIDHMTVAALGDADESSTLWLVTVGGRTTVVDTVGGERVTARNGERTLTLVSSDGDVRVRSGSAWSTQATGVDEIAYAG